MNHHLSNTIIIILPWAVSALIYLFSHQFLGKFNYAEHMPIYCIINIITHILDYIAHLKISVIGYSIKDPMTYKAFTRAGYYNLSLLRNKRAVIKKSISVLLTSIRTPIWRL